MQQMKNKDIRPTVMLMNKMEAKETVKKCPRIDRS